MYLFRLSVTFLANVNVRYMLMLINSIYPRANLVTKVTTADVRPPVVCHLSVTFVCPT